MGIFGAKKVIINHKNEPSFNTYIVGFDITDNGTKEYRIKELIQALLNAIPEFAFGHHQGTMIGINETLQLLIDAARAIYKIDCFEEVKNIYLSNGEIADEDIPKKYFNRGEFGELILHLLLREFHDTIPLLSKIYFKDALGSVVHGFDAVHIHEETKSLWLGESKLYKDGKEGVKALIKDIEDHVKSDYMKDEFAIISRKLKLFDDNPEKEYWIDLLKSTTKLEEQLSAINIPLLCTYESRLFSIYDDEKSQKFIEELEKEIRDLEQTFQLGNNHPLKNHLNIVLLLFPIQSKKELVYNMHKKLDGMQKLGV